MSTPDLKALIATLREAGDHDRNPEDGSGPLTFCHQAADMLEHLTDPGTDPAFIYDSTGDPVVDRLVYDTYLLPTGVQTNGIVERLVAELLDRARPARTGTPTEPAPTTGHTIRDSFASAVFGVYDDDEGAESPIQYAYRVADSLLSQFRIVPRDQHSVPMAPGNARYNEPVEDAYAAYERGHLAADSTAYGVAEHRAGLAAVVQHLDPNTRPLAEPEYYPYTGDPVVDELVESLHLLPRHIQTNGVVERLAAELRDRAVPAASNRA